MVRFSAGSMWILFLGGTSTLVTAFSALPRVGMTMSSKSTFLGAKMEMRPRRVARSSTCLSMMFDQLSAAITDVAKNLGPKKKITEKSIRSALRDVRRALLDADVNVKVADTLIEGVKRRSLGEEVLKGVTADQQFVKAMYDELLDIMGGDPSAPRGGASIPAAPLATGDPAVVILAGLQGAGKTTAAGKLALYLKEREVDTEALPESKADGGGGEKEEEDVKAVVPASRLPTRNRKVLLAAADVYRPAAITQLEVLGESVGVDVFTLGAEADPVDIAMQALEKAKSEDYDTLIVDTAGRQVIDSDLMDELQRMKDAVDPDETLLVVDSMIGQEAAMLTAAFDSAVGLTGAILTKMDGDSRGGAAVSVRGVSGKPIKFVGTGETVADLEPFYPDRMASRILGMGDVVSLVEKAAAEVSDAEAEKMQAKMMEAKFDFDDFLKQARLVSKMGSFAGVAKMIPGMAGQLDPKKMKELERRMKKNEAMIQSMTKKERANPELLITDRSASSRIMRITKGSGCSYEEGMAFMSEFQQMRTMMSRMSKQMAGKEGDGSGENRSQRRAKKKGKKGGRVASRGFG